MLDRIISKSALRREREKKMRRLSILSAAEKSFARKGYQKTRMEDIADIAEISVGAVYSYFKNKEDLLTAVMDDIRMYTRKFVGKAFMEADSSLEGIERAGTAFFEELCLHNPEKVLLLCDESIDTNSKFIAARKNFIKNITEDVNQALKKVQKGSGVKYSSKISSEVMAVCITSIYIGLGYHYKLWEKQPEETMTIGKEVVAYIVGGIKNLIVSTKQ